MNSRVKNIVKILWVNVLILGALLLLIEIVLRILGFGYDNEPLNADATLHHVHPENYEFVMYSPHGNYGGHTVYYDEYGRRVSGETAVLNANKTIWFFGDSFTQATELNWDSSYVGIIGSRSNHNVVNLGVASYNPLIYLIQLKQNFERFKKPDLVFIQIYSNDIRDYYDYKKTTQHDDQGYPISCDGGETNILKSLLRKSYVGRGLLRAHITLKYRKKSKKNNTSETLSVGNYVEDNNNPEEHPGFTKNVEMLDSVLVAEGIEHFFFSIPSKYSCVSRDWKTSTFTNKFNDLLKKNGLPIIDMTESFREKSKFDKPFFDDDIHCNELGNSLIAEEILKVIK